MRYSLLFGLLLAACCCFGREAELNYCRDAKNWIVFNGPEFPGATGKVTGGPAGAVLGYDFSGGGRYVGFTPEPLLNGTEKLLFRLLPEHGATLRGRITDATGKTFQTSDIPLTAGKEQNVELSMHMPFAASWGGGEKGRAPQPPLRSFQLLVIHDEKLPPNGTLTIRELRAVSPDTPAFPVLRGDSFEQYAGNWKLSGDWLADDRNAILQIQAEPLPGAAHADLTILQPQNGRPFRSVFRLVPANGKQAFSFLPRFSGKPNPRTVYQFSVELTGDDDSRSTFPVRLAGSAALPFRYLDTTEIAHSRHGVNTHFCHDLGVWKQRDRLFALLKAGGFKWIRDGVRVETGPDGQWRVRPADLAYLEQAHRNGIEVCAMFQLQADTDEKTFIAQLTALVRDTGNLVKVYELGNEPNNFGKWRQLYPGPWNGYDKKQPQHIARWVREHVKRTNLGAETLRKLHPQAVIIGTGGASPSNFHSLRAGLSKELDGLVDHPYSYSIPAERIPFSDSTERDGLKVADRDGTFRGLIENYRAASRAAGKQRKLYLTEYGWSTFLYDGKNERAIYAGYSEKAQALYLLRRALEGTALEDVALQTMYDFIDDGRLPGNAEHNFGLLRNDFTGKLSYRVLRRFNTLFAGAEPDSTVTIDVTAAPVHGRKEEDERLLKVWDGMPLRELNGVRAYAYRIPGQDDMRQIALWSMRPYSGEENNRSVDFTVSGLAGFTAPPVAIDPVTGDQFDLPMEIADGKFIFKGVFLGEHPLLIRFFRSQSNR